MVGQNAYSLNGILTEIQAKPFLFAFFKPVNTSLEHFK